MRAVHDILYDTNPTHAKGPVSFIQHGSEETGFEYECVCPFCAQTVGDRIPGEQADNYAALLKSLKALMVTHVPLCTAGGFHLKVYLTKTPLNTDSPPKVM